MATRYVVTVKPPDDHPGAVRVFGAWLDRDAARAFRDKVRGAADAATDPIMDESSGYAYLVQLETPRVREAKRWATTGATA